MTHALSMPELHGDTTTVVTDPGPSGLSHDVLKPGNHLSFRMGPEALSGVVDAVMADKSCFWIWADGGMGRRMITASDVAAIKVTTSN